jgi:FkbM family methyltransferase
VLPRLLRRVPQHTRGKSRLARALLGSTLDRRDVLVQDRDGQRFWVPGISHAIGFHLLVDGAYEPDEVAFARSRLPAGSVFVDVGANIGTYSIPIARLSGPRTTVVAIEASPAIATYLRRNLALNGLDGVHVWECAAHDTDGQSVAFYEVPASHFGLGSLAPQFNRAPISVPTQRLDTILDRLGIDHVDLLKIDVEGFEATVLRGAERLLTGPRRPIVMFEFLEWADVRSAVGPVGSSVQLLRDWGYEIWPFSVLRRGGPPLAADSSVADLESTLVAIAR